MKWRSSSTKTGIKINAISPGPVETPLLDTLFDPTQKARRLIHVPYGRFAQPQEIAEAAVFLASDASSDVNGTEFRVEKAGDYFHDVALPPLGRVHDVVRQAVE